MAAEFDPFGSTTRAALVLVASVGWACAEPSPPASEPAPTRADPGQARPGSPEPSGADPEVQGPVGDDGPALTRDEIRVVVRAKMNEVRACFEARADSSPVIDARVLLRFTLDAAGHAVDIAIVEDQLEDASVATCVVEALARWQFPRPRGGQALTITYPFVFSSGDALRAAGLPRVEGTVKPAAVGAVFDARRSELDGCISDEQKGTVGVAFTIDDGGTVTRISSYRATLDEAAVACILRAVSSWRFPPAAGEDEARVNHDLWW